MPTLVNETAGRFLVRHSVYTYISGRRVIKGRKSQRGTLYTQDEKRNESLLIPSDWHEIRAARLKKVSRMRAHTRTKIVWSAELFALAAVFYA